jgi:hypothetical protein
VDVVGVDGEFDFLEYLFCVGEELQFRVFQLLNLAWRELAAG